MTRGHPKNVSIPVITPSEVYGKNYTARIDAAVGLTLGKYLSFEGHDFSGYGSTDI